MTITVEQAATFRASFQALAGNIERAIVGKRAVVDLVLTALLSNGHVLLEDVPGTGKTALARAISQSIGGDSKRIQFTPDLLPGDVTGITVFDQKTKEFVFHQGPVFTNILLADEINRASPKTQSALLEVMEEAKVTVDGQTYPVGSPFLVIATQNPVEQAGTYRLPEAQLDRFLLKTSVGYPDHVSTVRILEGGGAQPVGPVLTINQVVDLINMAQGVYIAPEVVAYISNLLDATRNAAQVVLGSSIRGGLGLVKAAKVRAAAEGRNFVIPDDIDLLASPVLAHRLILDAEAEFDGLTPEQVIGKIVTDTAKPAQKANV